MKKNNYVSLNLSESKKITAGYASLVSRSSMVLGTLLTGIFYNFIQWSQRGEIIDALFVSMLIGATFILVQGLKTLYDYDLHKGSEFYEFVMPEEDSKKEYHKFFVSVFNSKNMTLSGIFYGLAIGSSPFILNVWGDNILLKFLLSAFLFTVNFATGVAFYALIRFFLHSVKLGQLVKVELWQRENPSTAFLIGATRRISLLASIYISICISSILFSVIPIANLVVAYSVFAVSIILASLVIPLCPIAQQTRLAKVKELSEINRQLQAEFSKIIEKPKSSENEVSFERLQTLLMLREQIDSIQTWPFKLKTLASAISIIFISTVPVILQSILNKLFL